MVWLSVSVCFYPLFGQHGLKGSSKPNHGIMFRTHYCQTKHKNKTKTYLIVNRLDFSWPDANWNATSSDDSHKHLPSHPAGHHNHDHCFLDNFIEIQIKKKLTLCWLITKRRMRHQLQQNTTCKSLVHYITFCLSFVVFTECLLNSLWKGGYIEKQTFL